jgi:putative toxin-antitoxin system antitoxin component (TIGR02293 family)
MSAAHLTRAVRSKKQRGSLGLPADDLFGLLDQLHSGLTFATLTAFRKKSGLTMAEIARVLQVPPRTLARRKASGTLTAPESERLARLAGLFDKAADLFEGDTGAALTWLRTGNKALGKSTPLILAKTEFGARAVEDLIGRLEFGVYS